MARTKEENETFEHGWQATVGNNLDRLLRDHQWEVLHRPENREPVWRHKVTHCELVQSQALKTISGKEVRAALCGEVV